MKDLNDFIYSNERKEVWLRSQMPKSASDLWKLFRKLGFTRHYDIFSFDRTFNNAPEIWQTTTIIAASVFNGKEEVYFKDKVYDAIQFYYLLPHLPIECISTFTEIIEKVSEELNLPMEYNGNIVSRTGLENDLLKCANEFAEKVSEPGSETAALLVKMAYPRKSKI